MISDDSGSRPKVIGSSIAMVGIGPIPTIAMLLPITFGLDPLSSLIMLAGIYYGAQYGGSTTSILVNMPGEASSIVTCIDGHQMAQAGPRRRRARRSRRSARSSPAASARCSSRRSARRSRAIAQQFNSPDYFSLMVLGLVTAVVLAHGSVIKAIGMVLVGLLFGLVGTDVNSGAHALHLRRLGAVGRHRFPAAGDRHVRRRRDHPQSRAAATAARARSSAGFRDLWPSWQDFQDCLARGAARHRRSARCSASCRAAARCSPSFASYTLEKKVAKDPSPLRQGRDRRRGRAGIRQQRGGADLVHSAADARPAVQRHHGADDGRDDHPGHPARLGGDDQAARPVLGHGRQHVDRQPDAAGHQPAADRHLGEAAVGALPSALSGDPAVLRDRRLQHQHQHRAAGADAPCSRCSAISCCGSAASRRRWCSASSSGR